MGDTLKAHHVQRQAYHGKSFVWNHVHKMLQVSLFFNNGVLFEKVNSFLPAEFFKKKRLAGKLSRETTYSFYFKKLKREKVNKIKEKRTRVCQCKNQSSYNYWNSDLKCNCRGQHSHSNCCKKCWKYVWQYWAKFEIDEYMNTVI